MAETNGDEDTVYVALGKNVEEGVLTLVWALQNLEVRNVCILHVHQPIKFGPLYSGISASDGLEENDQRAIRETERKTIHGILDNYLDICGRAGVNAKVIHSDQDNVGEGIVELIYQHSIKKLVIGAAADKHYLPGMTDIKSRKAKYVSQHAPDSCLFWFICSGNLIRIGKGDVDQDDYEEDEDEHNSNALFLYREEMRRRKEAEEALAKERQEHNKTKQQRDDMQVERDNAFRITEELLGKQDSGSSHVLPHGSYCEISVSEVQEATRHFDPSLKISEGDYGSFYKGLLHHTPVVIKLLHQNTREGPLEFQQKVEVLSRLRHPNLVTFIGACPELWALIFEYLPNGSLEDRLSCKDDTPPLSWKTRICIATELCSVLIFIHSTNPQGIVSQSQLKPGDILLDGNFVCKLNNVGIRRYNDGAVSGNSYVYSFGIILLQLLTGRSSSEGIVRESKDAIDEGNLEALLDASAGEWPFVQATQLAHLGVRCCEGDNNSRPDLASEVWKVLEPMRVSCGASTSSSSFQLGNKEKPPSYFMCPILLEVMKDPHFAADGFTYEADVLRSWLDSGHDTSPMTKVGLEQSNLVAYRSVRAVFLEWQREA